MTKRGKERGREGERERGERKRAKKREGGGRREGKVEKEKERL